MTLFKLHWTILYATPEFYYATGLLAGGLLFLMVGLRELRHSNHDGWVYLILGLFLDLAHIIFMLNVPVQSALAAFADSMGFWTWLSYIAAPAVIALFVLNSLMDLWQTRLRLGMIRLFFGLALTAFVYLLGLDWGYGLKGAVALFFGLIWIWLELTPRPARRIN